MLKSLRLLFWVRKDYHTNPGGDSVQAELWAKLLRKLGMQVIISRDANLNIDEFDIVHLWHLERIHDTYHLFTRAKAANKPILLATTYWPKDGLPLKGSWRKFKRAIVENAKLFIRCLMSGSLLSVFLNSRCKEWLRARNAMLNHSSLLLPNSKSEAMLLLDELSHSKKIVEIPNIFNPSIAEDNIPWKKRQHVLCVGHFCPRKNQLALIRALKHADIKISFIGRSRPMHAHYYARCLKEAAGQHEFLGELPERDVWKMMSQAKAHICVSNIETPGIANLEAAALGCGLLLPDIPPVRDYFGSSAVYFDETHEILCKVQECLKAPPLPTLRESVRNKFSVQILSDKLTELYKAIF